MSNKKEVPTLFYIDDSPKHIEIMEDTFKDKPFNLYCFDAPSKAMTQMTKYMPNIIISDYEMRPINAFKFAQTLPEFNFVIFTALTDKRIKDELMSLGNIKAVIKKAGMTELTSFIEELFEIQSK